MKTFKLVTAIFVLIGVMALIGYVRCVVKFIQCDFEEPHRAEVIYGVGTFTGIGAVIGWFNINDDKEPENENN